MRWMSAVAIVGVLAAAGCSDDDGEPDRITRIDGPAQVEDDDVAPGDDTDE